jgi:hypothetical protein
LDEDIPAQRQACMDSVIAHHPGWDVTVWRSLEQFGLLRNKRAFFAADELAPKTWPHARWQIVSNILRFEVLARHGGVYVDSDVWCHRPLDDLLERTEAGGKDGFLAWEIERRWLGEAVVGCVSGAPFMERIVSNLEAWAFARAGQAATKTVGPQYITPLLLGTPELERVLVLPQRTFFPARHNEPAKGDAIIAGDAPEGTWMTHGFFNYRRKQALGLVR